MKIYKLTSSFIVLMGLALSLAGCSNDGNTEPPDNAKRKKVVPVEIEKVKATDLVETFTLPAGLEAWEDLVLAAEIAGSVHKINFQEGDQVKEGEILVEIDPETIKSYLRRDQENVTVILRKLTRYQHLEKEGLVSTQELDDLTNSLTAAQAVLKSTELQLAKSFPRAPVSGTVDHLYIDRGEYVDPGKPLLRLVQIDKLKVIAEVPEKDILFLSAGQSVEIIPATVNSAGGDSLSGKIDFIAFSANPVTRSYRTKITIDNPGTLRPGMIVRTKFIRQKLNQVITAPLFAVMDRDGKKLVYVADSGVARMVPVTIGDSIGQRVVIKEGLIPGQSLIVKGQQLLVDGVMISAGDQ